MVKYTNVVSFPQFICEKRFSTSDEQRLTALYIGDFEQSLLQKDLKYALRLADSAIGYSRRLASSTPSISMAAPYFERYLANSPFSPRRILQLARMAAARPLEVSVADAKSLDAIGMNIRLLQLEAVMKSMYAKYVDASDAMQDALTGCFNFTYLDDEMRSQIPHPACRLQVLRHDLRPQM